MTITIENTTIIIENKTITINGITKKIKELGYTDLIYSIQKTQVKTQSVNYLIDHLKNSSLNNLFLTKWEKSVNL